MKIKFYYLGFHKDQLQVSFFLTFFTNDLLLWIENAELHSFSDDNTISCTEKSLEEFIKNITSEPEKAVQWFKENVMTINPDKLQVIIIDRKKQQNNPTYIKINDRNINSENRVRLLGLEIGSKLNFDKYITQLYQKGARQFNAI